MYFFEVAKNPWTHLPDPGSLRASSPLTIMISVVQQ
jgi:hypothetical protein